MSKRYQSRINRPALVASFLPPYYSSGPVSRLSTRAMIDSINSIAWSTATMPEIARYYGYSLQSLYRLMSSSPALADAVKHARERADDIVVSSVRRAAVGAITKETRERTVGAGLAEVITITREHAPSIDAAKLWLSSRQPDVWRASNDGASRSAPVTVVLVNINPDLPAIDVTPKK